MNEFFDKEEWEPPAEAARSAEASPEPWDAAVAEPSAPGREPAEAWRDEAAARSAEAWSEPWGAAAAEPSAAAARSGAERELPDWTAWEAAAARLR